ncbi:MAG: hypothetical protein ACPGVZ_21180 [Myxococcota bacterium]
MKRRAVADNLGPLVDTLANVVGILVIVLALTQIELGGALDRVLQRQADQRAADQDFVDALPDRRAELESLRSTLAERGIETQSEGIAVAEEILEALEELGTAGKLDRLAVETRYAELDALRRDNLAAQRALEDREVRAEALQTVSKERVARLPDPRVERGLESWVLVRHGRIFPVDRKALFDAGTSALARLLQRRATGEGFRPDEFDSASLYLRKRRIGTDGFRWLLDPVEAGEPAFVRLDWPAADRGIDPTRLESSAAWQRWLANRRPGRDLVKFHVWNDSFEAYGAARQATEAAGLAAGWVGYTEDADYRIRLSFGARPPEERDVLVD